MGLNRDAEIGVVLMQLGGPDSLEAVEPFLYNLFCDPDIINFPGAVLARKPLAKYIASRRAKKVRDHYEEIGGKSPIVDLTMAQARALQTALDSRMRASVFVAMRYWHPLTGEVIPQLIGSRIRKLILLPLYPQYSRATTGSSLGEWNRQCRKLGYHPPTVSTVRSYHDDPRYVQSIVERINSALSRFGGIAPEDIDLVFSAHGVPMSLINAGDPYQQQIIETVRLVRTAGGWNSPGILCYQSKVGPSEWLKPSLDQTLRDLTSRGRRNFLIVPVAFVTEHIETLHEINIEARHEAERLGAARFEVMPALNDSPLFIQCLSDLVLRNV